MEQEKGTLFIISGSSGVGKGTLIERLLKQNSDIILSISYTTRKPRKNERDGVNYFFISKEEFEKAIEADEFLEWAKFSDNYYGTNKNYIQKKLAKGLDVLLEIDVQGAVQIMQKHPDVVSIFIQPPSFEALEARLRNRNTETEEAILKRLNVVKNELELSKNFKFNVVNDNLEDALNRLSEIFSEQRKNKV